MSKKKQIVWYLNIVEFGPETYGIQNASQYYYRKDAKYMTQNECVSLIALLPKPVRWGTELKKGARSHEYAKRYHRILSEVVPWTGKRTSHNHSFKEKQIDIPIISDIPELE